MSEKTVSLEGYKTYIVVLGGETTTDVTIEGIGVDVLSALSAAVDIIAASLVKNGGTEEQVMLEVGKACGCGVKNGVKRGKGELDE